MFEFVLITLSVIFHSVNDIALDSCEITVSGTVRRDSDTDTNTARRRLILSPQSSNEAFVSTSSVTLIVFGNRDAIRFEVNRSKARLRRQTGLTHSRNTLGSSHMLFAA